MIQQCPSYNFSHGPSDVAAERISQIESGNRSPLCITEVKIEGLDIHLMLGKNSKTNIEKSSRGPEIKCVTSRELKIFESGGRMHNLTWLLIDFDEKMSFRPLLPVRTAG